MDSISSLEYHKQIGNYLNRAWKDKFEDKERIMFYTAVPTFHSYLNSATPTKVGGLIFQIFGFKTDDFQEKKLQDSFHIFWTILKENFKAN